MVGSESDNSGGIVQHRLGVIRDATRFGQNLNKPWHSPPDDKYWSLALLAIAIIVLGAFIKSVAD